MYHLLQLSSFNFFYLSIDEVFITFCKFPAISKNQLKILTIVKTTLKRI